MAAPNKAKKMSGADAREPDADAARQHDLAGRIGLLGQVYEQPVAQHDAERAGEKAEQPLDHPHQQHHVNGVHRIAPEHPTVADSIRMTRHVCQAPTPSPRDDHRASKGLDLALGGGGLVADQGPQALMHLEHQPGMLGSPALGNRHVDADDLADAAGAARQHDDPVGEPCRLLEIVGDVDARALLARPDRQEVFHQQLARLSVEGGQRLVEQQHGRPHDQRAGDADALAHAAGELLGIGRRELAEAGQGERRGDALARARRRERTVLERQADIVGDAAPGQQGEILEDVGEGIERIGGAGPEKVTRPAVGSSRPPTMPSKVDLPQPDGPISATVSPSAMSSSIPDSASTVP